MSSSRLGSAVSSMCVLLLLVLVSAVFGMSGLVPRADASWSMDRSFGSNGTVSLGTDPSDLALDRRGRVLVTGTVCSRYCSIAETRLRPSGHVDRHFGFEGSAVLGARNTNTYGFASDVDRKGRVVVAGEGSNAWESESGPELRRLNPDGSRDKSFRQTVAFPRFDGYYYNDVENLPNGKILVAGSSASGERIVIRRANPDGRYDRTFGKRGFVWINGRTRGNASRITGATNIHVFPSGKFLVSGVRDGHSWIARFLRNGILDRNFNGDGMATIPFVDRTNCVSVDSCAPNGLVVTKGGRIRLVANRSVGSGIRSRGYVIGLNADGSWDRAFGKNGRVSVLPGEFSHGAGFILELPDRSLLVAPNLESRTPLIARTSRTGRNVRKFGRFGRNSGWISAGVLKNKTLILGNSATNRLRRYKQR